MNTLINKTSIKLYKKNIISKCNIRIVSNNCLSNKNKINKSIIIDSDLHLAIKEADKETNIALKQLHFLVRIIIDNNFVINNTNTNTKLNYDDIIQSSNKFMIAYEKAELLKSRNKIIINIKLDDIDCVST